MCACKSASPKQNSVTSPHTHLSTYCSAVGRQANPSRLGLSSSPVDYQAYICYLGGPRLWDFGQKYTLGTPCPALRLRLREWGSDEQVLPGTSSAPEKEYRAEAKCGRWESSSRCSCGASQVQSRAPLQAALARLQFLLHTWTAVSLTTAALCSCEHGVPAPQRISGSGMVTTHPGLAALRCIGMACNVAGSPVLSLTQLGGCDTLGRYLTQLLAKAQVIPPCPARWLQLNPGRSPSTSPAAERPQAQRTTVGKPASTLPSRITSQGEQFHRPFQLDTPSGPSGRGTVMGLSLASKILSEQQQRRPDPAPHPARAAGGRGRQAAWVTRAAAAGLTGLSVQVLPPGSVPDPTPALSAMRRGGLHRACSPGEMLRLTEEEEFVQVGSAGKRWRQDSNLVPTGSLKTSEARALERPGHF
ncbi:hypothetical protein TREES_T100004150 [Tupaia chinensis]|uniref:Uncharacterized protein n=1 Tax=Tupaia chinensis TaxID=246437 RepID=L9KHS8_TUPCH|nr:hypothetical protein TREES_T100004150 [Tupaia chinensis]